MKYSGGKDGFSFIFDRISQFVSIDFMRIEGIHKNAYSDSDIYFAKLFTLEKR